MKRLWLAVGLLAATFSTTLPAQILDAHANIPFDFWLGQKLMPAGEYLFYHVGTGAVLIEGRSDTRTRAVFVAEPISRPDSHHEGRLEFTRYGDTYFLSKIWYPYQMSGYGVPKNSQEKELANRRAPYGTTGIALSRK
jgi:hypothetical protein